jgi:hypothetical protein
MHFAARAVHSRFALIRQGGWVNGSRGAPVQNASLDRIKAQTIVMVVVALLVALGSSLIALLR